MKKINFRDIAELPPDQQQKVQDWINYKLRKFLPTPEQVQARQENDNDIDSEKTGK